MLWLLYPSPLQGRDPSIHWIGGWVGTRADLNAVVKRKYPCLCQESNPGLAVRNLVTMLTEQPRVLLKHLYIYYSI